MLGRYFSVLMLLAAATALVGFSLLRPASALAGQAGLAQRTRTIPTAVIAASALPRLKVTASEVTEGGTLVYSISIFPAVTKPVMVEYAFSGDLSALIDTTGGRGQIPAGGTLTIARRTVDDLLVNGDRHVVLLAGMPSLSSAASDRFRVSASGLVRDNDVKPQEPPQVVIRGAKSITEGEMLTFSVQLSRRSELPVTVLYRLNDPAGVSAVGREGSVTIPTGRTTAAIGISTVDDSTVNGSRTVEVQLVRVSNAAMGKPRSARGTVADNDIVREPDKPPVEEEPIKQPIPDPPMAESYSIAAVKPEVSEGEALVFKVIRSGNVTQPGVIDYALNTTTDAEPAGPQQGRLSFAPGSTVRLIKFKPDQPIQTDLLVRADLQQSDGVPLLLIGSAQGTIIDNPANNPRPVSPPDWLLWLIPLAVLTGGGAAAAKWLRKPAKRVKPPAETEPPAPPIPDCKIGCEPQWGVPREPSGLGPLSIPPLGCSIVATPCEPITPYELNATFVEDRDEPDDQL